MKNKMKAAAVAVSLLVAAVTVQAEEVEIVSGKRLSTATALKIAQHAISACQKKGIQIGVTVTDRDGIPQVMLRDTSAAPITEPISKGKAYAAVMFNVSTGQLGDRANSPIGRVPGLVMSAGGLPIQVGGSLVGGVGVSGAPSGKTDEECAQAGVDAVQDDLEMAL